MGEVVIAQAEPVGSLARTFAEYGPWTVLAVLVIALYFVGRWVRGHIDTSIAAVVKRAVDHLDTQEAVLRGILANTEQHTQRLVDVIQGKDGLREHVTREVKELRHKTMNALMLLEQSLLARIDGELGRGVLTDNTTPPRRAPTEDTDTDPNGHKGGA